MALQPHERASVEQRIAAIERILESIRPSLLQEYQYLDGLLLEKKKLLSDLAERVSCNDRPPKAQ